MDESIFNSMHFYSTHVYCASLFEKNSNKAQREKKFLARNARTVKKFFFRFRCNDLEPKLSQTFPLPGDAKAGFLSPEETLEIIF